MLEKCTNMSWKNIIIIYVVLLTLLVSCASANSHHTDAKDSQDECSGIRKWEQNMLYFGKYWGKYLYTETDKNRLMDDVYYDATRVFYQISDYTNKKDPWLKYALKARDIYHNYLSQNNYRAAGYMNFGQGLYDDWIISHDDQSYKDLIQLSEKAAYGDAQLTCPDYQYGANDKACYIAAQKYSREIAYALQTNILAEKAGKKRNEKLVKVLVNLALNHIRIWTTGKFQDPEQKWHFVQAFMTGLTSAALIEYYERSLYLNDADKRIPENLQTLADWLWQNMWVEDVGGQPGAWTDTGGTGFGAFRYVVPETPGVGGKEPAPDLNMLIGPMYAWLYLNTGQEKYRERAIKIFIGGVNLASLQYDPKIYNQNYRWSFDQIRWLIKGDEKWKIGNTGECIPKYHANKLILH